MRQFHHTLLITEKVREQPLVNVKNPQKVSDLFIEKVSLREYIQKSAFFQRPNNVSVQVVHIGARAVPFGKTGEFFMESRVHFTAQGVFAGFAPTQQGFIKTIVFDVVFTEKIDGKKL
ncbi:hypothetical protein SDC9_210209 [bioreactor metagenome]|uniref:Uncharacterized protein n=1 Tax=bioreactor metagenome TaxID=1076179 RepID=A0A645JH75_9ZZZZ